jgi:hypothetical protein
VNVENAEKEVKEATEVGNKMREEQEKNVKESIDLVDIIQANVSYIVDELIIKLKNVWQWICDVCVDIYDFFVGIINQVS